jgi:hypothetical protein
METAMFALDVPGMDRHAGNAETSITVHAKGIATVFQD